MSTCSVEDCSSPAKARGWCIPHYKRWHKHGSPTDLRRLKHRPRSASLVDWFWSRVDKTGDCWHWTAATNTAGYGQIWDGTKLLYAHRLSYEMARGALAHGEVVDHICHTQACVNPAHLQAVTQKQNTENMHAHRDALVGVRGVSIGKRGKFQVRVTDNGVVHSGGAFPTIAEAEAAAIALRNELYTNNLLDPR